MWLHLPAKKALLAAVILLGSGKLIGGKDRAGKSYGKHYRPYSVSAADEGKENKGFLFLFCFANGESAFVRAGGFEPMHHKEQRTCDHIWLNSSIPHSLP
jgi:hypothetical protein